MASDGAAVDCSRYEGRRPENLGHRRLTAATVWWLITIPVLLTCSVIVEEPLAVLLVGRVENFVFLWLDAIEGNETRFF